MGQGDRDYLHGISRRQRPFSPPPRRSGPGKLGMALVFAAGLMLLYQAAEQYLERPRPSAARLMVAPAASPATPAFRPAPNFPAPPVDPPLPATRSTNASTSITKCVRNGSTSYTEGVCPHGAVSSQVTTRHDHNLLAPVRSRADSQAVQPMPQEIMAAHNPSFNDAAAKNAECEGLEKNILHWDAMARQPHSGQQQDWIREQRKKARDRQFHLRCR